MSLYAAEAQTSSVKLAWNPSVVSQLAGYRIYDGVSSHTYTNMVEVGNVTNATISGLTVGLTYFFSVTAYDTIGLESPFSNEISYTVTNSVPSCTYAIAPTSASFGAAGGAGNARVTAGGGCFWMVTSGVSWVTINSGSSGSGNGTVSYTVLSNTNATARTGTLTMAGQTFTVLQTAAPLDTTPPSVTLSAPANVSTVKGTISLTATASDNVGVTEVQFYCDGTGLEGTSVAPPYACLCDTTKLANGKHRFNAKAYDAAGNWTTSGANTVTVRNR